MRLEWLSLWVIPKFWTHARQSAEKYLGITQHCDSVGSEGYQHAYRSDHAGGQYYWVWGCEQHTATTFMWANHIIIWLISLEGHLLLIIPQSSLILMMVRGKHHSKSVIWPLSQVSNTYSSYYRIQKHEPNAHILRSSNRAMTVSMTDWK